MYKTDKVLNSVGVTPDSVDEWDDDQRLAGEKETLGLYLTGHPINRVDAELNAMTGSRIGALLQSTRGQNDREKRTVAGLVVGVRHGKTQRGRMGTVTLDDRTGRMEATVFPDLYEQVRELLTPDRMLAITGTLSFADGVLIGANPAMDRIATWPPLRLGERWLALPGRYNVTAAYTGYRPLQQSVDIPLGDGAQFSFGLCEIDQHALHDFAGQDCRLAAVHTRFGHYAGGGL